MTPERRSALLRGAGFAAALIAVGAAGLWTGRMVQRARQPERPPAPAPDFAAGDRFPAVPLVAADGAEVSSNELIAGRGGVVLFLDPDCPACTEAVAVWQSWLDAGALEGVPVVGISTDTAEAVAAYRADHGLGFPIYLDRGAVFAAEHGVTVVPTTVMVDPSGTVRFAGYQPLDELGPEDVVERVRG